MSDTIDAYVSMDAAISVKSVLRTEDGKGMVVIRAVWNFEQAKEECVVTPIQARCLAECIRTNVPIMIGPGPLHTSIESFARNDDTGFSLRINRTFVKSEYGIDKRGLVSALTKQADRAESGEFDDDAVDEEDDEE